MIKKLFFIFLFVCPVLIGQTVKPRIALQDLEFNYTGAASHTFIINNSGSGILKINKIRTTCKCITTSLDRNEIGLADSAKLAVTYIGGKKGPAEEYVYLSSNDETTPEFRITIAIDKKVPPLIFPNLSSVDVSNKNRPADSPIISFNEMSHNFGDVPKGNVVGYNFVVTNKGKSTLHIKRIRTSCGCTAALLDKNKLEAGESSTIHVEFDSATENGNVNRTIEVLSNDPVSEKTTLNINARVIAR